MKKIIFSLIVTTKNMLAAMVVIFAADYLGFFPKFKTSCFPDWLGLETAGVLVVLMLVGILFGQIEKKRKKNGAIAWLAEKIQDFLLCVFFWQVLLSLLVWLIWTYYFRLS